MKRTPIHNGLSVLLNDERVRRAYHEGRAYYSIIDLIRVLSETEFPDEYWNDLKKREPALSNIEVWLEQPTAMTHAAGACRLIQSVSSAAAEKLKRWLA